METILILFLAVLAAACCVMFWFSVLRRAETIFRYEHLIADFRRDISQWEHEHD